MTPDPFLPDQIFQQVLYYVPVLKRKRIKAQALVKYQLEFGPMESTWPEARWPYQIGSKHVRNQQASAQETRAVWPPLFKQEFIFPYLF